MTIPDDKEQFYSLCARIVEEKESDKFRLLVHELSEILDKENETASLLETAER